MATTLPVFCAEYSLRHADWLKYLDDWQPRTPYDSLSGQGEVKVRSRWGQWECG